MGLCFLIIFGAVIGALARLIVPGKQKMGILLTIGIGALGAVLGGIIGYLLNLPTLFVWVISLAIATGLVFWFESWQNKRGGGGGGGFRGGGGQGSPPPPPPPATGQGRGIDSLREYD